MKSIAWFRLLLSRCALLRIAAVMSVLGHFLPAAGGEASLERQFLYVATPGIRNYLEYGGHGLVVFDIQDQHRFVKRIPLGGLDAQGHPLNVKGVAASAATRRIYVTTTETLTCLDLISEKILWEKRYEGGCDRLALSPDGKIIYLPSLEKAHWFVVEASTGKILKRLEPDSGAHNTIYALDGAHVYLAGLKSPLLRVADARDHRIALEVGPFSDMVRPFTVNRSGTLCFVNVNNLLGFEVGDLRTGKMLHRVEVAGFEKGPTKRHGCPSHGIGLTPDEEELWVTDAHNRRVHVFDATALPPKPITSLVLRDEPGWVTFSLDGRYAYPSTGDVIDVASRRVMFGLKDEAGRELQSEKMVEIHFRRGKPVLAGDQFGLGRKSLGTR